MGARAGRGVACADSSSRAPCVCRSSIVLRLSLRRAREEPLPVRQRLSRSEAANFSWSGPLDDAALRIIIRDYAARWPT